MSSSTNTTITPLEEAILQGVGHVVLGNLAALIVLTFLYGIFIPLFSISVYMMIRRGLRTLANWAALIGTSINFAIITTSWIMLLTWLVFAIQIFLVDNASSSLEERISLEIKTQTRFAAPVDDLQTIPLLISDAFVVWRASILFPHKRALAIPIICLISSVGLFIASTAVVFESTTGTSVGWAQLATSLATNLFSTGMIGWRLWIYRKHVVPNLGDTKSPVQQIIITLIESGAVFCSTQIASLIISIVSPPSPPMAVTVILQILFSSAALYPTLVVLICRNQSSRIDAVASLSMSVGHDLQFASMQVSQSQSMEVSAVGFAQQSSYSSIHEAKPNTGDVETGAS